MEGSLRRLLEGGASVAWLGFEGSFDFRHLLADDVAVRTCAVGASGFLEVNLGDSSWSTRQWLAVVRQARSVAQGLLGETNAGD